MRHIPDVDMMQAARRGLGWLAGRPGPYVVNFEPTMRCNLRCEFCNVWRDNPFPSESSDLVRRLMEAWNMGCMVCAFTGGEPTLRSDIGELVSAAKNRGYYVSLVTNGVLLGKKTVLEAIRGVDYLAISFVNDEAIFNKTRGVAAYGLVKAGITAATDEGMDPNIFCTVSEDVLPAIGATTDFAKEHRLIVHYNMVTQIPRQGVDKVEWSDVQGNQASIREAIEAEARRYRGVHLNRMLMELQMDGGFNNHVRCRSADTVVSLKPDGSVSLPCSPLTTYSITTDMPLAEGWVSPERAECSQRCGEYPECFGCGFDCMYQASLVGRPRDALRWLLQGT